MYKCEICNYGTDKKFNMDKHLYCKKHIKKVNILEKKKKDEEINKETIISTLNEKVDGLTNLLIEKDNRINGLINLLTEKDKRIDDLINQLNIAHSMIKEKEKKEKKKYRTKQMIPKSVKASIWSKYIGVSINEINCPIGCGNKINANNFEAGHIIAESKGGKLTLENLRPICGVCNKSMNNKNMLEWLNEHGFEYNKSVLCM